MPTEHQRDRYAELAAETLRRAQYKFRRYFPDTGPLRRELYPRSLVFFAAGKVYRERLFLAANRTSKTVSAAYEITAHTTGDYPAWWPGRRFDGPTEWWAAGDTRETTRDIVQLELFGTREDVRCLWIVGKKLATSSLSAHAGRRPLAVARRRKVVRRSLAARVPLPRRQAKES